MIVRKSTAAWKPARGGNPQAGTPGVRRTADATEGKPNTTNYGAGAVPPACNTSDRSGPTKQPRETESNKEKTTEEMYKEKHESALDHSFSQYERRGK